MVCSYKLVRHMHGSVAATAPSPPVDRVESSWAHLSARPESVSASAGFSAAAQAAQMSPTPRCCIKHSRVSNRSSTA